VVICLEQGAHDLHVVIKIQNGFTFMLLSYPGCPGKEAIKWVSVCLSVCLSVLLQQQLQSDCFVTDVCDVCGGCVLKGYSLAAVNANTAEYQDVANLFFETMTKLSAGIVRIDRLENPVLWQFYAVLVLSHLVHCFFSYRLTRVVPDKGP